MIIKQTLLKKITLRYTYSNDECIWDLTLNLKQNLNQHPDQFYYKLLETLFGPRNGLQMEEEFEFEWLFPANLHPAVREHFNACMNP